MNTPNIGIVAIAYNRVHSLDRLLNSLANANYAGCKVNLIISIDKSDINDVINFAENFKWQYGDKIVVKHEQNLGLKRHILSIGEWLKKYEAIVVLEDDVIVSPAFYKYSIQLVEKYKSNDNIAGISLYSFPVNNLTHRPFEAMKNEYDIFLMQIAQSWGQIWMRHQWNDFYSWYIENRDFKFSNDIPQALFGWHNSWLRYHTRYCIEKNKYFVYPYFAFSSNCGDKGTHAVVSYDVYQTTMQLNIKGVLKLPDDVDSMVKYDAFFENYALYEALHLSTRNCILDCNGYRCNAGFEPHKRYIVTSVSLPYKVIKSFGLTYRPIEMNILLQNEGKDLFVYDTAYSDKKRKVNFPQNIILYNYRIIYLIGLIRQIGLGFLLRTILHKIKLRWHH